MYNDIKNGHISLQKEDKIREEFILELNEILKGNPNHKSEDQISGQEKLLNSIMIILEWYLRLNTNQFVEKGSKYLLLNKCFKDYQ